MGGRPSHPELLDWLAVWFRDDARGSMKQLHRLIVTSATYRQSSNPVGADVRRLTSTSAADHEPAAPVSETELKTASGLFTQQRTGSGSQEENQNLLTSAATTAQIDSDNRL